jgi:hypothetical protein
MIDSEAREELATQLMNLAESLLEADDVGVVTEDGDKKELKVTASLGHSYTIIAIKMWDKRENNGSEFEDEWSEEFEYK